MNGPNVRPGIHQFVPMLHLGDAVGNHARVVQGHLRKLGVASEIYVEIEDPATIHLSHPADEYFDKADGSSGDLLVYQCATASKLADVLHARPETLVVNYHNVTPPQWFAPWDAALARHQVWANLQLELLAKRCAVGVAVSEFNRADLVKAGFAATEVVPPAIERTWGSTEHALRRGVEKGARWLAVGRLAPNKAFEQTLVALLLYRARFDAGASLTLVGRPAVASYAQALRRYVADMGLSAAVTFAGTVSDEDLNRAYEQADVLVVTSQHEGFCLPVVEAMGHGIPVVAYSAGALPEVLGDAGVLLFEHDPSHLAETVSRLLSDEDWYAQKVAAGYERIATLGIESGGQRLAELLVRLWQATASGDGTVRVQDGPKEEDARVAG